MAKIYVTIDGETIEAKGDTLQDILDFQAQHKAQADAIEAEVQAKATAKAAVLERLGITAEEAVLLLS